MMLKIAGLGLGASSIPCHRRRVLRSGRHYQRRRLSPRYEGRTSGCRGRNSPFRFRRASLTRERRAVQRDCVNKPVEAGPDPLVAGAGLPDGADGAAIGRRAAAAVGGGEERGEVGVEVDDGADVVVELQVDRFFGGWVRHRRR
jgi:hypothetical protein